MTNITIPPEALKEAAQDVCIVMGHRWEKLGEDDREYALSIARAACLAMLRSWPEVGFVRQDINTPVSYLVLPLTEPSDADK